MDNIGYSLSRTVRSCIQYKASVALGAVGAVGACSRCRHRKCMENAMSMFDGKGNHGFSAVVVETLVMFRLLPFKTISAGGASAALLYWGERGQCMATT